VPKINVVLFREDDGTIPFVEWFGNLPHKAQDRCRVKIELLSQFGHDLRRPDCENLGNGIWELRAKFHRLNLRILYFFCGREVVVLSHGLAKQQATVPAKDIDKALRRKRLFEAEPNKHRVEE
jgi:phage-related protein